MTEVGSIIGTAQYLSPEQARGAPVDDRSDLYSVGVLLYELLTGVAPYNGDTPVEIAMKHLSAVPEPPSAKRPEIPPELDAVVLRALAKNPDDRYQNAGEMDADLSAISKGLEISETTTDAATTVLAGAGLSAPTMITKAPARVAPPLRPGGPAPPPTPPGYYDLQNASVRRPIWPWLLALALAAAVGIAFWIVYQQLAESTPVAVPAVKGLTETAARKQITAAGLTVDSIPTTSETVGKGKVIRQDPIAGEKIAPNSAVSIWVSSGSAEKRVISVIDMESYKAINALQKAGFIADARQAYNEATNGTVYRQSPLGTGNRTAPKGSTVIIWVSKGPAPIDLPDVTNKSYATAVSILKGNGFTNISRQWVDSDQAKGIVTAEDPTANSSLAPDTPITLSVSKGPQTVTVPSVTDLDVNEAESTLTTQGFTPNVVYQDTTNSSEADVVLSQTPKGNKQAVPGSTVTIYVGNYIGP